MDESCHVCMSHVMYEWVMSHMNELRHVWMSHVTYAWVMPQTNEPCHNYISHVIDERVKSQTNESCQVWTSHVIKQNAGRVHQIDLIHRWKLPVCAWLCVYVFERDCVCVTAHSGKEHLETGCLIHSTQNVTAFYTPSMLKSSRCFSAYSLQVYNRLAVDLLLEILLSAVPRV